MTRSLTEFTTLQWLDTPIDTFVTWIHWNVQIQGERRCNVVGQVYADRRSNLLGENAEKLLFLAYIIRLFQFNYWQKIDVSVSLYDWLLILRVRI